MGCGEPRPKHELLRLVSGPDGVEADPTATRPGRGAYLCGDPDCLERALRRRAFARALRAPVAPGEDALDFIREWQRSEFTR